MGETGITKWTVPRNPTSNGYSDVGNAASGTLNFPARDRCSARDHCFSRRVTGRLQRTESGPFRES